MMTRIIKVVTMLIILTYIHSPSTSKPTTTVYYRATHLQISASAAFTSMPPPPTPFHVLRHHQSPIHHLAFSSSNELIYSGDEQGNIAVIDLKLRRVVASWKAHEAGVLGVGEWEGGLVR